MWKWNKLLRITHLVTANTTFKLIEEYLNFQEKIREKYPQIFYLDEGDYNVYYMPDNSIRTSFLTKS